jgi:uncharacterized protein YraI
VTRHFFRRAGLVLALWVIAPLSAFAQGTVPLVVETNANLRTEASSASAVIRVLLAGEHAGLLSAHTRNDYLHVVSGADTGWVYSQFVELAAVESTVVVVTPPAPSSGVATAPADYHGCSLEGNPSPNGSNVAALRLLNEKKNRWHAPTDADVDPSFTLDALLHPGADDGRFDDSKAANLEGWVVDVKVGGVETVNCRTTDPQYRDTHIEVARTPNAPETQRVIVEVTPRWRSAMEAAGVDWSTQGLKALIGKRVRFRGWVLFDAEHRGQALNTAPGNSSDWRATVWEVHPVTAMVVTSPE